MDDSISLAIVDDHELIRNGIAEIIHQRSQHKVVFTAMHGVDLLGQLSKLDFVPDVCLLDISMPVMDGYDTMKAVHRQYPGMRCLVITMLETEFTVINMIRNGARGYLSKSSNPKELIKAIEDVHTSGYYYSSIASEEVFDIVEKSKISKQLTEKEREFLILCCSEIGLLEIAAKMCIGYRTAEDYQQRLCKKLHVKNRMGLVLFVFSSGLLPPQHL